MKLTIGNVMLYFASIVAIDCDVSSCERIPNVYHNALVVKYNSTHSMTVIYVFFIYIKISS